MNRSIIPILKPSQSKPIQANPSQSEPENRKWAMQIEYFWLGKLGKCDDLRWIRIRRIESESSGWDPMGGGWKWAHRNLLVSNRSTVALIEPAGPIAAATTTTAAPPPSAEPLDTIEDNDVDYWSSSSTTSLPSVSSPHRSRHLPDDDDDIDDDDGDDDADDASDANGHTKRAHTSLVIDGNWSPRALLPATSSVFLSLPLPLPAATADWPIERFNWDSIPVFDWSPLSE